MRAVMACVRRKFLVRRILEKIKQKKNYWMCQIKQIPAFEDKKAKIWNYKVIGVSEDKVTEN